MSKPQINVTPLIDVLLVLLIIFMVVTPMKPSAFEAKIPSEPRNPPGEPDPLTLIVIVDSDSMIRLNSEELRASVDAPSPLTARLESIFQQREQNLVYAYDASGEITAQIQKAVFIKAPAGLPYGSVAKVVDAVKMAGANPIGLQIDGLEEP